MTNNNLIDISNQVISMDKEYVTRDGSKVRILCTDNYSDPEYPVVAIVGSGYVGVFMKNGKYVECGDSHDLDLIDIEIYNKSQFKEGDILVVGVYENAMWNMRIFSHFDDNGHCCCFDSGMQSGDVVIWGHFRKATEEEIATAFLNFNLSKIK